LPSYMVPACIGFLPALPTSTAGKLDRQRLPWLAAGLGRAGRKIIAPRTAAEAAAVAAFTEAAAGAAVSVEDDFFLALGGDSLSATAVVVRLREQGWSVGARDLYEAPTPSGLAARMRAQNAPAPPPLPARAANVRPHLCTAAQAAWLAVECVLAGALLYALGFELLPWLFNRFTPAVALLATLGLAAAGGWLYIPLSVAWAVAVKRVLIGRYCAGRESVWGGFYLRHWVVAHTARHVPWALLQGTAWQCAALRALGASVGKRVYIHRGVDLACGGWDLLALGDGATLGQDAALRLVDLVRGQLVIGAVSVGAGAALATRAGMDGASCLGAGAVLGPLSWLPSGSEVPAGECWEGIPAVAVGASAELPPLTRGRALGPAVHASLVVALRSLQAWTAWLPVLFAAAAAPSLAAIALAWWDLHWFTPIGALAAASAAAAMLAVQLAIRAIAARSLGRTCPGVVCQWSWEAIRLGAAATALEAAGRWLSGSMCWPYWLRWAGMRIGRGCEISTILDVVPALISLDEECFFADGVYLAPPWRQHGAIVLAPTSLGRDCFLGNHAVIPGGRAWPAGMFVGVATLPPPAAALAPQAWFGVPAMALPRRAQDYDRRLTHEPGPLRLATRVFWELARFALPLLPIALALAWWAAIDASARHARAWVVALVAAPACLLAAAATCCLALVAAKWILLGRVRPKVHAFWSCWCGRWDLLYIAWGVWAAPLLEQLEGTLLLNAFLRLTGMRIGREVVLGPGFAQVVDPDMLRLHDHATVNCHFQAHTFEDRMLKLGSIEIGPHANVGDGAVVLYGAALGAAAGLGPQSVLMKGDQIPAAACFVGAPARAAAALADAALSAI
ncbi:MAG: phosphopantetheine-binding protein, partial [Terriglobales bacterium]